MSGDLSRRVIRGSSIVFALSIISSVVGYVSRSLYSHTLSIEEFGLFFAGLSLVSMIWTYMDLGFGYAVTYLMPKYLKKGDLKTAWNVFKYGQFIEIAVSIVSATILVLIANFIASSYFKIPESSHFVKLLAVFLVVNTFSTSMIQVFMGLQKEIYYSSIVALRTIGLLLFSVIFWKVDAVNVYNYMISWVMGYLVVSVTFLILLKKNYKELTQQPVGLDKTLFKKMSEYALPNIMTTVVTSIYGYSDTFFLTILNGISSVGVYNVVGPLALIPLIVTAPMNNLVMPLISHLSEGEEDKVKFIIDKIMEIVPFVGFYFSLFLIIFPSYPIHFFFGGKWLGETQKVLVVFSIAGVITALRNMLGTSLLGLGQAKKILVISTRVALINLLTNFLLIKYFGVMGVAINSVVIALFYLLSNIVAIRKIISITLPIGSYVKLGLFGALLFMVARITKVNITSIYLYFFVGFVYSVVYGLFGYYLKLYDKKLFAMITTRGN